MDLVGKIESLIGPTVESMGFKLVQVRMLSHPRRTLQVMAERDDGTPVTVDDCAEISGAVSALLDVEDPIQGAYQLEVSSTGIDRPLVRLDDFERFAGFEAKAEVDPPIDGRRRFRGRIVGVEGDTVRMETKDGVSDLPFAAISTAKLVLTDELIAWSRNDGAMTGKDRN